MVDFGDRHKIELTLKDLKQLDNSRLAIALDCTDSETRSAVEKIIAQNPNKDWVIGDLLNPQPLSLSLSFYKSLPEESAAAIDKLRRDFFGRYPIESYSSLEILVLREKTMPAIEAQSRKLLNERKINPGLSKILTGDPLKKIILDPGGNFVPIRKIHIDPPITLGKLPKLGDSND
jgi:hypothetical protein